VSDRFDELVGEVDDQRERERLRRVHELLLSVDPPPERSPALDTAPVPRPEPLLPRRRRRTLVLLAAALAAASFGAGWLAGARDGDVEPQAVIAMSGQGGATGSIELLPQDASGNWPMLVLVRGLEPSRDRTDFYELWLTKDGKPVDSCGRFTLHPGVTTVTLSVPYGLRSYDGWVVTRAGSDEILLTTA
jgi:Anti-sigma-K factor rskA